MYYNINAQTKGSCPTYPEKDEMQKPIPSLPRPSAQPKFRYQLVSNISSNSLICSSDRISSFSRSRLPWKGSKLALSVIRRSLRKILTLLYPGRTVTRLESVHAEHMSNQEFTFIYHKTMHSIQQIKPYQFGRASVA